MLCLLYAPSPVNTMPETPSSARKIPDFSKRKGRQSRPGETKTEDAYTSSVSSADFSVFSAPSSAPSMTAKYCSGQSFSLWLIRCLCALSSRIISGLKYRSTGSPHTLISCMITGRLGIVASFSIFARYRESMLTISANVLRDRCFALRAAFTSAPKVSKPGQSLMFAILHHPLTLYISYFAYGMLLYAYKLHFIIHIKTKENRPSDCRCYYNLMTCFCNFIVLSKN